MRTAGTGLAAGAALTAVATLAMAACAGDAPPPLDDAPAAAVESAPPGTDIWLASLTRGEDGSLTLGEAANVTRRAGYDNQPAFLPDGSGFLYTVIDDAGQADIWRWADGQASPVTTTAPESEYSGTPMPSGDGFSAIRVEADSTQRLWRFAWHGGGAQVLLPDVAPVGYHAWVDPDVVVIFVLGAPATLQVARVSTGQAEEVARDIGRSIQPIPGTAEVSWVQRMPDGATEIRRLDPATGVSQPIIQGIDGEDFHAWTPDGTLLQAHGGLLHGFRPGSDQGWRLVADLTGLGITLSRLAVNPAGTMIALVGEAAGG